MLNSLEISGLNCVRVVQQKAAILLALHRAHFHHFFPWMLFSTRGSRVFGPCLLLDYCNEQAANVLFITNTVNYCTLDARARSLTYGSAIAKLHVSVGRTRKSMKLSSGSRNSSTRT